MISIVITTYGGDHWREVALQRALPSANEQSGIYEVILHHEPQLTIGPARNRAAAHARGEWLLFLDADDELDENYCRAMTEAICTPERPEPALLQPSVQYLRHGRSTPVYLAPVGDLRKNNFLVIGTLLRRKLFIEVGGFEDYEHGFEDWSLWAKCWKAGAEIFQVPEAIYKAWINPRSKHKLLWRNKKLQQEMHYRIETELFPGGIEAWAR